MNLSTAGGDRTILQWLADETKLPLQQIERYFAAGTLELLADGLNEIPGNTDTEVLPVMNQLRDFAFSQSQRQNRLVLTSRPLITAGRQIEVGRVVTIALLERDSISEMIDRISHSTAASEVLKKHIRLQDDLAWESRTSVVRMAGLPLVITMLASLADREGSEDFHMPRTRGELFERWVRYQLSFWEEQKRLGSQVSGAIKLDALAQLAKHMLEKGMGTVAQESDVFSAWGDAMPRSTLQELAGASILQWYGSNGVSWWHQGVRDSCAARYLYGLLERDAVPTEYLEDRDWDDPFVYLVGRLSAKAAVSLIRRLLADDPQREGDQSQPFLAMRCYLEIRNEHDLRVLEEDLAAAVASNHQRTQEITGDIDLIQTFAEERLRARETFYGRMLLGKILQIRGHMALAENEFTRALELPTSNVEHEVDAYCHAGTIRRRQGDHDGAISLFCHALSRAHESGQHMRDDLPYYEVGYVFEKQGRTVQALRFYDYSFEVGVAESNRLAGLSRAKAARKKLGFAYIALGQKCALLARCHRFEEALEIAAVALEAFDQAGLWQWTRNMCNHLTLLHLIRYDLEGNQADLERAEEYHRRGAECESAFVGNALSRANRHRRQALLCLAKGETHWATEQAELARIAVDQSAEKDNSAEVLHTLGLVYLRQGHDDLATKAWWAAIHTDPNALNRWGIAQSLRDLSKLELKDLKRREAVQHLETGLRLFQSLGSLEAKTCIPVIEEAKASVVTASEYRQFTRFLPQLDDFLPRDPCCTPLMEHIVCRQVLEELS